MNIIDYILYEIEIKSERENEEIFRKVLDEFYSVTNTKHIYKILLRKSYSNIDEFLKLKNKYIYNSKDINEFFSILTRYNYKYTHEYIDLIYDLAHLQNPNRNLKVIKKYLNSPVIDDVSFNGKDCFTIITSLIGKLEFILASKYYANNENISEYISFNNLVNRCHDNTLFMAQFFEDYYSITSLCPNYFSGFYHHSYTLNSEESLITDLGFNIVMDKTIYYKLFESKDVSVILNKNILKELEITNTKTNQQYNRCTLLKIALYKEYLNHIGYSGKLENAPSLCKRLK